MAPTSPLSPDGAPRTPRSADAPRAREPRAAAAKPAWGRGDGGKAAAAKRAKARKPRTVDQRSKAAARAIVESRKWPLYGTRNISRVTCKDARFMAKSWDSLLEDGALKWVGTDLPGAGTWQRRGLALPSTGFAPDDAYDQDAPPVYDIARAFANHDGAAVKHLVPRTQMTYAEYTGTGYGDYGDYAP